MYRLLSIGSIYSLTTILQESSLSTYVWVIFMCVLRLLKLINSIMTCCMYVVESEEGSIGSESLLNKYFIDI